MFICKLQESTKEKTYFADLFLAILGRFTNKRSRNVRWASSISLTLHFSFIKARLIRNPDGEKATMLNKLFVVDLNQRINSKNRTCTYELHIVWLCASSSVKSERIFVQRGNSHSRWVWLRTSCETCSHPITRLECHPKMTKNAVWIARGSKLFRRQHPTSRSKHFKMTHLAHRVARRIPFFPRLAHCCLRNQTHKCAPRGAPRLCLAYQSDGFIYLFFFYD